MPAIGSRGQPAGPLCQVKARLVVPSGASPQTVSRSPSGANWRSVTWSGPARKDVIKDPVPGSHNLTSSESSGCVLTLARDLGWP